MNNRNLIIAGIVIAALGLIVTFAINGNDEQAELDAVKLVEAGVDVIDGDNAEALNDTEQVLSHELEYCVEAMRNRTDSVETAEHVCRELKGFTSNVTKLLNKSPFWTVDTNDSEPKHVPVSNVTFTGFLKNGSYVENIPVSLDNGSNVTVPATDFIGIDRHIADVPRDADINHMAKEFGHKGRVNKSGNNT